MWWETFKSPITRRDEVGRGDLVVKCREVMGSCGKWWEEDLIVKCREVS